MNRVLAVVGAVVFLAGAARAEEPPDHSPAIKAILERRGWSDVKVDVDRAGADSMYLGFIQTGMKITAKKSGGPFRSERDIGIYLHRFSKEEDPENPQALTARSFYEQETSGPVRADLKKEDVELGNGTVPLFSPVVDYAKWTPSQLTYGPWLTTWRNAHHVCHMTMSALISSRVKYQVIDKLMERTYVFDRAEVEPALAPALAECAGEFEVLAEEIDELLKAPAKRELPARAGHDPEEIDRLLDQLGMMVALAAAADGPPMGGGSGIPPRRFDWYGAGGLAENVLATVMHLMKLASLPPIGQSLTQGQQSRCKALLHWVGWINSRMLLWNLAVEESRREDVFYPLMTFRVPPSPRYPLSKPVPADLAIDWPKPLPVYEDFVRYLDIATETLIPTGMEAAKVAAVVADAYFTGGRIFMLLAAGLTLMDVHTRYRDMKGTVDVTPLMWTLAAKAGERFGPTRVAAVLLGAVGVELATNTQVRVFIADPSDPNLFAIDRQSIDKDAKAIPFERVKKVALMALLRLVEAHRNELKEGRARAAPQGVLAESEVQGDRSSLRRIVTEHPTPPLLTDTSRRGGAIVTVRVQHDVARRGDVYMHPATGLLVPLPGSIAALARGELTGAMVLGLVKSMEAVLADGSVRPLSSDDISKMFDLKNGVYVPREPVLARAADGSAVALSAPRPGLLEVAGEDPVMKTAADALVSAIENPSTTPERITELRSKFLEAVFKDPRHASQFTEFQLLTADGPVTVRVGTLNDLTVFASYTADGRPIAAEVLSGALSRTVADSFLAGRAHQRLPVAMMGALVDTVLFGSLRSSARSGGAPPDAARLEQTALAIYEGTQLPSESAPVAGGGGGGGRGDDDVGGGGGGDDDDGGDDGGDGNPVESPAGAGPHNPPPGGGPPPGSSAYPDKAAARAGLEGDQRRAANRFFREAARNAEQFSTTPFGAGSQRLQFFSPARNAGYGKRYVQEIASDGQVLREWKETWGPSGLLQVKWVKRGP